MTKGSREDTEEAGALEIGAGAGGPNLNTWTGGALTWAGLDLALVSMVLKWAWLGLGRGEAIFLGFLPPPRPPGSVVLACWAARILSRKKTSAARSAVRDLLDLLTS